jgi:ferritin-like metal-binding protein YciE
MAHNELYLAWLNDAYSLEQSLTQVLERHVADAKDYPQVQARMQQHLEETRRHAELVKSCIERLGSDTSKLKSGLATVTGAVQGMTTVVAKDDLIKNALADYSSEHLEIASYTSLISAAQTMGDLETVSICQQILRDEEAMQSWLAQQIPLITQEMLQIQAREHGR